jgi:hypothetical protein
MVVVFGKVFYLVGIFLVSKWSCLLAWEIRFVFGMKNGVGMFHLRPCS